MRDLINCYDKRRALVAAMWNVGYLKDANDPKYKPISWVDINEYLGYERESNGPRNQFRRLRRDLRRAGYSMRDFVLHVMGDVDVVDDPGIAHDMISDMGFDPRHVQIKQAGVWGDPNNPKYAVKVDPSKQPSGVNIVNRAIIAAGDDPNEVVVTESSIWGGPGNWQASVKYKPKPPQIDFNNVPVCTIEPNHCKNGTMAAVLSLKDIHATKLDVYEPQKSISRVNEAVESAIQKFLSEMTRWPEVDWVILPIGDDLFNSDNKSSTTTRGTPQHDALGWRTGIQFVTKLVLGMIDTLIAGGYVVDVPVICGNHDEERTYWIGQLLKARYGQHYRVSVEIPDHNYTVRTIGETAILFVHGDIKRTLTGDFFANVAPTEFANASWREIHCGHRHHQTFIKDENGTFVKYMPALDPNRDQWHQDQGYRSRKAAMYHLYDYKGGPKGDYPIWVGVD